MSSMTSLGTEVLGQLASLLESTIWVALDSGQYSFPARW